MKRCLLAALFALLGSDLPSDAAGTWVPLANSPPGAAGHFLLLSDGTVIAENLSTGYGPGWLRLTPDIRGSYINGTWSTIASMHDTRLDFESDVLMDGRVFVAGGEYGTGFATSEVYSPVSNVWTVVAVPTSLLDPEQDSEQFDELQGFFDCSSVVLANGKVLIAPTGASTLGQTMLFDPGSNAWEAGPTTVYQQLGYQAEASWVKLPDNSILTVNGYTTSAERYIPASNTWISDATCPVALYDIYEEEEGPALLLPNGKAIFFGSTGHTAIYTPSGSTSPGSWLVGPDFPNSQGMPDAPAAMMVNGKILCAVSEAPFATNAVYNSPTSFYEYDYVSNSFTRINAPGGGMTFSGPTYPTLMLDLPDGSVLFTHRSTDLYVYQPDGVPLTAGKPSITSVATNNDGSLHLTGTLFNGLCQGAAYGDDEQMDSNFPLVRFIDASGNVRYGRTYNWSSTGVMTGNMTVTTECAMPAGASRVDSIQVVANGIASDLFIPPGALPQIEVFDGTNVLADGQTNAVNFGAVQQGQAGSSVTFTMSNAGGTKLTVTNITVPAGFTLTSSFPSAIAPGASGQFVVQLNSTTAGTNTGDISIQSNDPTNNMFIFPIIGVVNPKVIALDGNLAFGVVSVGSSGQQSFIISNLSHATLTVSNISYPSSAFSGAFSGTIPAQSSQVVSVTFSPTVPTNYSGTVMISASSTNGDTSLPVTGFGANANLVLTVITSGDGTVTGAPKPAMKVLRSGTRVTLKAVPGKGSVFSNWAGSFNTSKNPLSFSMTTNTIVQANFIPNPFIPFVGTYNGLFTATDGVVAETNAGMLKDLSVTSKGIYSGSLLINGATHALTGAFNLNLQASNAIANKGSEGSLEVTMILTLNNSSPQLNGTISNAGWLSSNLTADLATNTPLFPAYTMLIPPDASSASAPIGFGYALITGIAATARTPASVKITGALADGTVFSQSVPVSLDSYAPVYANLYGNHGLLLGWINLTNAGWSSLVWVHPPVSSGLFTKAFTNISQIAISPWTNPPGSGALPGNFTVTETMGNTPVATNAFTITITNRTLNFGKESGPATALTGTISAKTGLMKVSIGSGRFKADGYGVVLLNGTNGGGYFLTTTNTGAIELAP